MRDLRRRCTATIAIVVAGAAVFGCTAPRASKAANASSTTAAPTATVETVESTGASGPRAILAQLVIDDSPPPAGYLRDLFPTWKDVDHDGCDARRQALIRSSTTPPEIGARCAVISGTWTSAYDGVTTTDPGEVQIDHVVPLANAWRSGADGWTAEQRTQFANDQFELWAVSAASNQSKGDSGPEQWRPPREEAWCEYAERWTTIKSQYRLTATTSERDALGQMLETC